MTMSNRIRIVNTVTGRGIDRLPYFFKFGPWKETLERGHNEGLPDGEHWSIGLGFDSGLEKVPVNLGYCPEFEYKLLEDLGDRIVFRDRLGITQMEIKRLPRSRTTLITP